MLSILMNKMAFSDKIMSSQFANLQEYIASLPTNVIQNIYGHPASCLAIFRFV